MRARRASLQTFELAPLHGLQLRISYLVLLEHVVGLGFDFLSYLPRIEPRLIVKLSVLVWQHQDVTFLHSVVSVEAQANALARCQYCQGMGP